MLTVRPAPDQVDDVMISSVIGVSIPHGWLINSCICYVPDHTGRVAADTEPGEEVLTLEGFHRGLRRVLLN